MKLSLFIAIMIPVLSIPQLAHTQTPELTTLADNISKDYIAKKGRPLFKQPIAIISFENSTATLKKFNTGNAVASSLQDIMSDSTVFTLVEREKADELLKEIELNMTGLIKKRSMIQAGKLTGAKLILMGRVTEVSRSIQISARLVDTESGSIISAKTVTVPKEEMIAQSRDIYFSSFQSKYGIAFGLNSTFIIPNEDISSLMMQSLDISYRIHKNVRIGGGYFFLANSGEMKTETYDYDFGGSVGTKNIKREYRFSASGPKFFVEGLYPFLRWLHGSVKLEYYSIAASNLQQDVAGFPLAYIDNDGNPQVANNQRLLVNSEANEDFIHMLHLALKCEVLISKRVSFTVTGGYLFAQDYEPHIYEANGRRQWTDDTDTNGSFEDLYNFNFARFEDGGRVKFNFSGATLSLGVAVHI